MAETAARQRPNFGVARRIRVPLGFAFAIFYFWRAQPNWLSLSLGAAVAALGVALRALAAGYIKKDREVTMTGPYACVRHPLYLGSIIMAAGFVIAARDIWITLATVAFFVSVYVPVIRSEEAYLRKTFPQFEQYSRTVPSLMPRSLPLAELADGFSRELYAKHREYNAMFGAAAMLAALAVKMLWFHE